MTSRLILICGLPGAGKTTLAKRLATETPAVRLCADEWMGQLGIDLHDEAARSRLDRQFWLLAQELLRLGQRVILESGFWARSERDEMRLGARALGIGVELHFLDVTLEERWQRIERRNAEDRKDTALISREQLASWTPLFEAPDDGELALFDEPLR